MKKLVLVLMASMLVAGCSTTIDPNTHPEVYKARKALTLPKETCVKYPNARTKCM